MSSDEYGFPIEDQEAEMLEALIKSPIYAVLKKVLNRYKEACHQTLLTSKDPPLLFETQGRIIGMNVVTKLPELLVQRNIHARKLKDEESKLKGEILERAARIKDPSLPPVKRV